MSEGTGGHLGGDGISARRWQRLDLGGTRVHCLLAGERGTPVVLLHGGGIDSSALSFARSVPVLEREHRVAAPDWPGYGLSDDPGERPSLGYYAGLVGPILDGLGLARASLVGISLGGGAALAFALQAPERVDRLVLVGSYGLGREVPWGRLSYLLVRTPLVGSLTWGLLARSRTMLRWALSNVTHDRRAVTDDLVEEAASALARPGAGRAFQGFQRAEIGWRGLRTDLSGRLGELRVPTLVVHGRQDGAVPVAWAERAGARIPDAELRVIEDCGHIPPWEHPEEFNEAIREFLGRRR